MKAIWNDRTIAETDDTVIVEGNHYFPSSALDRQLIRESDTHTTCSWKGEASYYDLVVDGKVNRDAVWYYPNPKDAAKDIAGRVAFWKGVEVR